MSGDGWPGGLPRLTEAEVLLGRAVIAPGADGAAGWRSWLAVHAIDQLDRETAPVAAMLHRTLLRSWPDAPGLERLRGSYRQNWARQTLAVKSLVTLLQALASQGTNVVLHRNAAMALTGWFPTGTRSLGELDLLVAEPDLAAVDGALRRVGWTSLRPLPPPRLAPFLDGIAYRCAAQVPVRLRWHPFSPTDSDGTRADFFRRVGETVVEGMAVRRPEPVDLLLMTAHAVASGTCPPLPGLLDALRLLDSVDAEALQAALDPADPESRQGLAAALRHWTAERDRLLPGAAPDTGAVEATPAARAETSPRSLGDHWRRYRGICAARSLPQGTPGFAAYLLGAHRWYWGTSTWRTLARAARRRAMPERKRGAAAQPASVPR